MWIETLQQVDLFRDLAAPALDRLATRCQPMELAEDQVIFREGEPATAFYVVVAGAVALYRDAIGKPVQLLGRLGPGDYFGEMGIFDRSFRTASSRAVQSSTVLLIARESLLHFLDGHPEVTLRLQMAAARRHSANVAAALEIGHRQEVRIRVSHRATLVLDDGSRHRVMVENLSAGGLRMAAAPRRWREGDEVTFTLDCGDRPLSLSGRVAWRRSDVAGIAFTHRPRGHETSIQRTLRHILTSAQP